MIDRPNARRCTFSDERSVNELIGLTQKCDLFLTLYDTSSVQDVTCINERRMRKLSQDSSTSLIKHGSFDGAGTTIEASNPYSGVRYVKLLQAIDDHVPVVTSSLAYIAHPILSR